MNPDRTQTSPAGSSHSAGLLLRRPRPQVTVLLIALGLLLPSGLGQALARARYQAPPPPPPTEIRFQQLGSFEPAGGVVQDAVWLDSQQMLVLSLGPQGAELLKASLNPSQSSTYISSDFISTNICPAALHDRLSLQLQDGSRYLVFHWFTDAGERRAAIVDLSTAPGFQLLQVDLPAGMQVQQVRFSPDDRYVVLSHDGYKEGSAASLLVLDLQTGNEVWRLGPHDLNFIHACWWNKDPAAPGFAVSAEVHKGQFQAGPGIARFDLGTHQWSFTPEPGNLLLYREASWGSAAAFQSAPGAKAPYFLKFSPSGGRLSDQKGQLLLNSEPVGLELLPDANYALLVNRSDASSNQLWQLNLAAAKRYLVDSDCQRCELSGMEQLLVVAGKTNAVKVYQLSRPAGMPAPAAVQPDKQSAGQTDEQAGGAAEQQPQLKRSPGRQPGSGAAQGSTASSG